MKPFYISTAIPYTNANPHLGFALEAIEADVIARFEREKGRNTFFLTGTDEHGIKNYKTALEKGVSTQEFVDTHTNRYKDLTQTLNLSNDDFIRTTDQKRHWPSAQKMWEQLEASGDIFTKEYEGLYCEGCEAFYLKKDLPDGICPDHKKPPVSLKEKNYFFRLSKYSDQIVELFESGTIQILPSFRQNEFLTLAKEGLQDVSFSRPSTSLPWGIPVPTDSTQQMYVWCDALTNYISALEYEKNSEQFQTYWEGGEIVHVIGKDIVRFHAGIWIGMLLSAGLKLPDKILIHGFITCEGQKMSKSIGNIVDPFALQETYGTDAVRYYLLREIPVGRDGDFSLKKFEELYTAHLANNLGNLLNRVLHLSLSNNIPPTLQGGEIHLKEKNKMEEKIQQSMKNFALHDAITSIWEALDFLNKKIDQDKPWALAKTDPKALPESLSPLAEFLRIIAIHLRSFLPETSEKILKILGRSIDDSTPWGEATDWKEFGTKEILFQKIEDLKK